ncbi:TPA: hypothetical protein UMV36_003926 [Stenotrophomonas maltophilia]|nr:hypothetical protein [Stenotrophomonas maltophilia]MBH1711312.1 hypothetical protein [Stenotrophomonas maltophilia]HEL3759486.1 hypothetical protein [Stenotrophomonas maltophilia]
MQDVLMGDKAPLQKLEMLLEREAIGGKNKRAIDFAEAYPLIEQHLSNKVPQKTVLEKFNAAYGHTIYAPQFRKLLDAERKRRAEIGQVMACAACGNQLPSTMEVVKSSDTTEE